MATDDFTKAVDDGLKLSKRLNVGQHRELLPPKPPPVMDKDGEQHSSYLPTAPMVYAMINDTAIVDDPDCPSYQPRVYNRCDPPALIPLQMNGVELEVDCYLDTAFVKVCGSWRIHCVMANRSCDCLIAVPMGEQGSILGLEVDVSRKSYCTRLVAIEDSNDKAEAKFGGFLRSHIFTVTIPQVDGGSNLSFRVSWSQKCLYSDGQLSVVVPFTFPEHVAADGKKFCKKEKIQLSLNYGTETEVLCKTTSHPLKELRRHTGKLDFVYESEVLAWSHTDFSFSYNVSSSHIFGGVLLQSPSLHDVDQREMFCIYFFPGNQQGRKVFRKDVVFIVDISGSMRGKPLEDTKIVLYAALSKLHHEDSFNIITFNGEAYLFSTSMELATKEAVERAIQWISINFIAEGGTNILPPLNKAMEMLSHTRNSVPIIFLVTDGAVEDERHICDLMKTHLTNPRSISPRIYTFGIGSFCNHYFLRMLATLSRGHYDAAYDQDSIVLRMQNLITRASSAILANISIDSMDDLDEVEVYASHIPDLSSASPLTVFGRYQGNFPDTLKVKGVLSDSDNLVIDLKIHKANDTPIDRVSAKEQIDLLTAQAWFSKNKELEEKVAKISIRTGVVSEFTRMLLIENTGGKNAPESSGVQQVTNQTNSRKTMDSKGQKTTILLKSLGVGFGNLVATAENISPGSVKPKKPDAGEIFIKAASTCCSKMCYLCCGMCCIQCCLAINDKCLILLAQMCTAMAVFGCVECCLDVS